MSICGVQELLNSDLFLDPRTPVARIKDKKGTPKLDQKACHATMSIGEMQSNAVERSLVERCPVELSP